MEFAYKTLRHPTHTHIPPKTIVTTIYTSLRYTVHIKMQFTNENLSGERSGGVEVKNTCCRIDIHTEKTENKFAL